MHQPLLAPGIHACTFDDIERVCITPFSGASRDCRAHLLQRLNDMLDIFDADFGLAYAVWMDGSYLSDKPMPGDIDCVCLIDAASLASLDPAMNPSLLRFTTPGVAKARFGIDAYFQPGDDQAVMYWRGVFGFDRNNTPKGFFSFNRPQP